MLGPALGMVSCATESDDQGDLLSVAPDGWKQVLIDNNYAWHFKVTIDEIGHYEVSWSPCTYNKAWGVTKPEDWSDLVSAVNRAAEEPLGSDEKCFKVAEGDRSNRESQWYFEGDLVVKSSSGTRTLLSSSRGEVCTRLQDEGLAKEIYEVSNRILLQASKEDCPPSRQ